MKRAPRSRLRSLAQGIDRQGTGGARSVANAFPVADYANAVSQAQAGAAHGAGADARVSKIDQFTLAADGAQDLTLTYLPVPDSENVSLRRLVGFLGDEYTLSGQVLSLIDGELAPLIGDKVQVQYDYLGAVPTAPIDNGEYARLVLDDHPIAYYRLNDSGTAAADSSGNAHHASSYTGTLTRAQASLLPTETDLATLFSSNPGYFTVPASAGFNTAAITLEFWSDHGTSGTWVPWSHPTRCQLNISGGQGEFLVWVSGAWQFAAGTDTAWTSGAGGKHLGVTYDGSAVRFFKNGVQYGADHAYSTALPSGSGQAPKFGSSGGNDNAGVLDEFAVYGTALAAARFAAHYAAA